ncbi:hypothetical protein BC332_03527 [Capsicum chinense]|nr:hypothetical protein BC332_03527 [Capsicum chinense]
MVSQISISYSNSPSYPPIQCTHDTIINHLTESLSTSLIISKHCEIPLQDEASDVAKQIKEKAFVVTGFMTNNNDGGIEIHKNERNDAEDQPTLKRRISSAVVKVGPIPIDNRIRKELVTQIQIDIKSNKIFYTDSNGRDFLKRINLVLFLKDNNNEFSLLVDKSVGGSSLVDGQLEIMLH